VTLYVVAQNAKLDIGFHPQPVLCLTAIIPFPLKLNSCNNTEQN